MTRSRCTFHVPVMGPEGSFNCCNCGRLVEPESFGTRHRNHCPHCLWSRHLDLRPGDRRCVCRGPMAPVSIWLRDDGEGALIHRCTRCGALVSNRIAGDDDPGALRALSGRIGLAVARLTQEGGANEDR